MCTIDGWDIVVSAASGLIGAALGGYIAYSVAEKPRRRKSNYDSADLFWKEADKWAERPFNYLDSDIVMHNASIDRLSPHVNYLKAKHPKVCDRIWPHWVAYHGGDAGRAVRRENYTSAEGVALNKDYWIEELYQIADTLRDA